MTLQALYDQYITALEKIYGHSESSSITQWVFEKITGIKKPNHIADKTADVSNETEMKLSDALSRLILHTPVQYVLGESWFYKMKLKVSPAVLIPRPETEELVEYIINDLKKNKLPSTLLDIGTGSGCIAIALKKNLPPVNISAIDVSIEALQVAKENANDQELEINFIHYDFLNEVGWPALPQFDIIVSNPPYIPFAEKEILDKNVTEFEPALALFIPDEKPLLFYEKIEAFARSNLKEGGKIFLETHEALASEVAALFDNNNYALEIKKDMSGKQRFVIVTHRFPLP